MQIRPGGEKLSDTKVGEFDRRALLLRLSAMQAMRRTLRPIITDAEIGSAVARRRWSRRSSCTEQKQGGEGKLFHFRGGLCIFSPVLLSGNEQMFGGEISHLPARFSQLILFSPYKAGNEISLSAVSPHVVPPPSPPTPPPSSLRFYQDILCRGEEDGTSSPSLKKRNCL